MSFDRPAPLSPGKTQWEALTKEKFQGKRCCFGQLVWYRTKTPGKRTLDPNMAPALFLGWRVDPGLRYRNVVKVMDYEAFRKDGSISVHDVPEPELFVEDGPPSFPIAAAADRALHGGKTDGSDPPTLPLREAPFGAPPTPSAVKSKSVYITVERIIKFKETPGCRACAGHSKIHSAECKKRFSELVSADRAEAAAKSAAKTESKEPIPIVHTEGDEELARAIHACEHEEDPKIAVSAEDVAHEFDAAEAGEPAPSRPGASFFDTAPATAATSQVKIFGCSKKMPTVWFGTISCQGRIFLPQKRSRIAPFPQKDLLQLAPLVPCFRGAKQTTFTMVGLEAYLIAHLEIHGPGSQCSS